MTSAAPVFTTTATRYQIDFRANGKAIVDQAYIKSMAALTYEGKVAGGDKALGSGLKGRRRRQTTIAGYETNPSMTIETYISDDPNDASRQLFAWFKACLPPEEGGLGKWSEYRANGSIVLYSPDGEEVLRWNLERAWPKKYSIADMDSTSGDLAVETYEIVAESIIKQVAMSGNVVSPRNAAPV
jgi:phage tail-like protein